MKITLIGQSFDKNSGQGVYKFSGYLYENLKKLNKDTKKVVIGDLTSPLKTLFYNIIGSAYKSLNIKSNVYLFMMPEISLPCLFKRPSVVVIYDLIPLLIRERKEIFNKYFKFMMKIALKSNHLVTVSKSTKKDLINLLNVKKDRISLIYGGVDHKQFYPINKRKKNKKFTLGYIGGLGKRKNIEIILKVAEEFGQENVLFKIAGRGPELNKLIRLKNKLGLNNVEFVGFVPEEKLNNFYNSLDVFIFPSLYEGFGLPVLEAMACGVPIIASNRGAIPEIVGNAGILVNPQSTAQIIGGIKKLMHKKNLEILRKKSIKRAKRFGWETTAREYLKLLRNLTKK